jgi:hypothetical protein
MGIAYIYLLSKVLIKGYIFLSILLIVVAIRI